jgi:hypothetical protein
MIRRSRYLLPAEPPVMRSLKKMIRRLSPATKSKSLPRYAVTLPPTSGHGRFRDAR